MNNKTSTQEKVLSEILTLWNKYPQQRLGQLLLNFIFTGKTNDLNDRSMWEMDEKEIVSKVKNELSKGENE
jgi:hypothetical protein